MRKRTRDVPGLIEERLRLILLVTVVLGFSEDRFRLAFLYVLSLLRCSATSMIRRFSPDAYLVYVSHERSNPRYWAASFSITTGLSGLSSDARQL